LKKTTNKSLRRKGQAVTIDAVALLAKVSPMTVSRVVNGHGKVRETTRERVMRAVRELRYTPNLAASSLAAARGTRIALIYNNPSAAYLRELLVGALRGASRTAAQLVIDAWDGLDAEGERKAARALASSVAGAILPPPLCESHAVISELASPAPASPSAGKPSRPKISTQFKPTWAGLPIHITQVAAAISARPWRYWRMAEYTKKQGIVGSFQ